MVLGLGVCLLIAVVAGLVFRVWWFALVWFDCGDLLDVCYFLAFGVD